RSVNLLEVSSTKNRRQRSNAFREDTDGSDPPTKTASAFRRRRGCGENRRDGGNPGGLARARFCPGRNRSLAALERLHARLRRTFEKGDRAGGREGARHQAH